MPGGWEGTRDPCCDGYREHLLCLSARRFLAKWVRRAPYWPRSAEKSALGFYGISTIRSLDFPGFSHTIAQGMLPRHHMVELGTKAFRVAITSRDGMLASFALVWRNWDIERDSLSYPIAIGRT
jgi:hypothetical protein